MSHEPPRTSAQLRRDRSHGRLLGWSSVLFLCLFLPAVDGCDSEVYPVEFLVEPSVAIVLILPHLLSLPLALVAAADREHPLALPRHRRWLAALVTLTFVGVGLMLIEPLAGGRALLAAAVWSAPLPFLIATLASRRLSDAERAARWRMLCGAGLFAYFFVWFSAAGLEHSHGGLYLSMVASLGIAHSGRVLARNLPPDVPALPAARVL